MFTVSVLLVLFSSYLFLSILDKKLSFKNNLGFIFFLLLIFCQIILSFEVLSLFKLIAPKPLLVVNGSFFLASIALWLKNERHLYRPKLKEEFSKIIKALKRDKVLAFASLCFIVFFVSMLIMALFFPVKYGDALGYYLPRCTSWIQQGSLAHFITTDSRQLIMPVNSELFYTWVLLFLKNEIGISIFPFIFYINAIYVIYNFLGELGFCRRKRLWSIFVFSSLALVYAEAAIPGADLWIGSLMLTSIYLFFLACKYNKTNLIYFSTLSYAIAIGTKTTSIIAFPMAFMVVFIIAYIYSKENIKKYLLQFFLFLFINFLIFSSYNYILNFLQYMNPVSNQEQFLLNKFRGGVKGYLSNVIKYAFAIFDISGVIDVIGIGKHIDAALDKALALIGADRLTYTSPYFYGYFHARPSLDVADSLLGVVGMLTFYPAIIYSVILAIKKRMSKKVLLLASLALFYVFNVLIFSRVMVFTRFNMRYLLAFAVVASPILVYTYVKRNMNAYKLAVTWFLFVYLAFNAHAKPLIFVMNYIRYLSVPVEYQSKDRSFILEDSDEFRVRDYFLKQEKGTIGVMLHQKNNPIYYIHKLSLNGFQIETVFLEIIKKLDLSKYDYIIAAKEGVFSTEVQNYNSETEYNAAYCLYRDWEKKEEIEGHPVAVFCEIPYAYLEENGFEVVKEAYNGTYVIYKNKNKK